MDLFTYLMAKNDHNTSVNKDLFSYLLGKNQSGTYTDYSGTSISANNTKKGKMKLDLKGNTSQTGTPTPDTPIPVNVVSGDNEVVVTGKNLANSSDNPFIFTANTNTTKTLGQVNLVAGTTYYYSYTIDNATSSSTRNTPFLQILNGTRQYESAQTNYNATTGRKVWTYNCQTTGTYEFGYWCHTPNVNLSVSDFMISTSNDTNYEPYQSQTYPINLSGEELFDYSYQVEKQYASNGTQQSSQKYTLSNNVITISRDKSNYGRYFMNKLELTAGTYSLSFIPTLSGSMKEITYSIKDLDNQVTYVDENITITDGIKTTLQFTLSQTTTISIELQPRTSASGTLTFTNVSLKSTIEEIELCKIETYQDKFIRNSGKQLWQGNKDYTGQGTVAQIHQTLAPGTYTASYSQSVNGTVQFNLKDSNGSLVQAITTYAVAGNSTATFTITSNEVSDIWLYLSTNMTVNDIMINEGSTSVPYEPYGTGQWCKYNAIKEYTFTGNETPNSITGGYYYYMSALGNITYNIGGFNTKFQFVNDDRIVDNGTANTYLSDNQMAFRAGNTKDRLYIKTQLSSSDLKTTLANTPLYYVPSSEPYLSLIEDNNLIEQLDNLQNAMSYSGTTNINQVNNDKAFIISTKALEQGSNEVVVNNIGNAYSKPLIALEGSGNVDIYLENTQILKANVEDKMNIDIAKLEAYNPDTSVLLNRQVIGNYNSMTLQPGNNTIRIDGALDKATISNYTRWI